MHIEPTITFQQYKATLEVMRSPAERRFGKIQWLRIVLIIIFSFSLVIALKIPSTRESSLLGFIILVPLLFALSLWGKRRTEACLKRVYTTQEKQLNGQQMDITQSGISGQWADGNARYQYKWSAFERLIDLPDAFIFLPNAYAFVRIPKESLSLDEQQDIRLWGTSNAEKTL